MDKLTLVTSVVQELSPWCQMYHIRSNLYIAAGILCTPDVVMIFWRAAIAIEDHGNLPRVPAEALHIAQVTVGNLLPSLPLFPLNHVEKPSTINHQTVARLVSEVKWIGQHLQASLGKDCFVRLVHFLIFVAEQGQR